MVVELELELELEPELSLVEETETVLPDDVSLFTHEPMDEMITIVRMTPATTSTKARVRRGSEKNACTTPRTPPRSGCRWGARPRWGCLRATLGLPTLAMFLDDCLPERVDAAS